MKNEPGRTDKGALCDYPGCLCSVADCPCHGQHPNVTFCESVEGLAGDAWVALKKMQRTIDTTEVRGAVEAIDRLRDRLTGLRAIVNEQAEDEALWCIGVSIVETYHQQELRRLHAAIEGTS